jgi:hypothetical protein
MTSVLQQFRDELDDFMQFHPQSPLDEDQRETFQGLAYFDESPALVVVPEVERLPESEPLIEMETSTGDKRFYRRYARLRFSVDGEPATLTVYSDPRGGDFFLPFRDATSGTETYGAGRYLDNHRPGLRQLNGSAFELDFNFAYNPYCAYSPYYSCPLPPRENWLTVSICAGEKDFARL